MKLETRQEAIIDLLRALENVEVDDLAARFAVTTQTIRTDLRDLSASGLVHRTRGGARRIESVTNRQYADRRRLNAPEKLTIGKRAAALVPDHCSVALNIGTTTEQVAGALSGHKGLMVLSNNVNIIRQLIHAHAKELVLVGGTVRPSDGAVVGDEAVDFISRYKVDYAIIGASALDTDGAILDFDAREVSVARAILRNSRKRILVCDSSKFELTAPVRIGDIGELDFFVTDAAPPKRFAEAAARGQTSILTGEPGETGGS